MSKARTPEQKIAALIRDVGLSRIKAAIQMAEELTAIPSAPKKKPGKLVSHSKASFQPADSVDAASATAK